MGCFNKKRIVSLLLTGALVVSCSPSVFALDGYNEVTTAGGVGNSDLTLTVENTGGGPVDPPVDPPIDPPDPVLFSAYVPVELPIKMDLDGKITVPTNAMIINGVESKGIAVTDISVVLENGWASASYEDDFATKADNTQEIALKLRDNTLQIDSTFPITADNWKIAKNSYIDLNMGVKIPKQTVAENKGKIATIGFTLDWSGDDVSTGPSVPVTPPVTEQFTVSYTTDGNGSITGNSSATIDKDNTLTFPTVSANEGYVFDKWVNSVSNEEVTTSTIVTSNLTIKALFKVAEVEKVQVTFVADENGSLEGQTNVEIVPGDTVAVFPTPKPARIAYAFDKWVDSNTNMEVSTTTPITSDLTIKALFALRPSNPSNWFTVDTKGNLTGFTDEYANMADAPTDLVIPRQVGGVQVTGIGANAFKGRSAITSVVIPDTVTQIGNSAFMNCISLINVDVPSTVKKLSSYAFKNCYNISELKLYDLDVIEIGCFASWGYNQKITIKSLKTENTFAFGNCLAEVYMSDTNVTKLPFELYIDATSDSYITNFTTGFTFYETNYLMISGGYTSCTLGLGTVGATTVIAPTKFWTNQNTENGWYLKNLQNGTGFVPTITNRDQMIEYLKSIGETRIYFSRPN